MFAQVSSGTRSDVISDFNITFDTLKLVGYDANEFATAITTAKAIRSYSLPSFQAQTVGMQVTLSDKTQISFMNLNVNDLTSIRVVT